MTAVAKSVRDFEAVPMTLADVQEALYELRSAERNHGPGGDIARLCRDTHAVLEHVVHEYLRSDPP